MSAPISNGIPSSNHFSGQALGNAIDRGALVGAVALGLIAIIGLHLSGLNIGTSIAVGVPSALLGYGIGGVVGGKSYEAYKWCQMKFSKSQNPHL